MVYGDTLMPIQTKDELIHTLSVNYGVLLDDRPLKDFIDALYHRVYNAGYQEGCIDGNEIGYEDGWAYGSADGYNTGYRDAIDKFNMVNVVLPPYKI